MRILHSILILILLTGVLPAAAGADLPALVQRVRPAIVTVVVYDIDKNIANIGSGFFINRNGHLITNHHVLVGKYSAEIRTFDGKTYAVKHVIAANRATDLIKVSVDIPPNEIWWIEVSPELPAIAEQIVVVGSPMGLEQTVSEGIVSSIRSIPAVGHFFQMSAPISQGSSGSPVVNMRGEVVGVASFQFLQGQNLNFAVSGQSVLELETQSKGLTLSEWTYQNTDDKSKLTAELCRKGYRFSINGEDQKALHYFLKATETDPTDPLAWNGLGYCHAGLKNHEAAIAAYQQAIKINPADETAYFNLGNYYVELGRLTEAVDAYKSVVHIKPDLASAHFKLGLAYARLGLFKEGMQSFNRVIDLEPAAAPAYFNAGLAYSELGRYREAIEAQKKVIQLKPEYAPAYFNIGLAYGELGQRSKEKEALRQTIRIDPSYAPAHYQMGLAMLRDGNRPAAMDEYKMLMDLDGALAKKLFDKIYE
jgi:tetratricopeptide (TPR) repeat protein